MTNAPHPTRLDRARRHGRSRARQLDAVGVPASTTRSRRPPVEALLLGADVENPRDPEAVREHPEAGRPGGCRERLDHGRSLDQSVPVAPQLVERVAAHGDEERLIGEGDAVLAMGRRRRTLALLSLLQRPCDWPAPELARRLGVSESTVRRDIDRLRELDYAFGATRGPAGGYRLCACRRSRAPCRTASPSGSRDSPPPPQAASTRGARTAPEVDRASETSQPVA